MPLRKITGTRVAVDPQLGTTADDPSILVYEPGRAHIKTLALKLLGLTALNDPDQVQNIRSAAANLPDADDRDWTAEEAQRLLMAVGTLPAPSHLVLWRLPGQGTILLRAVQPETARARRLIYPARSHRPTISLLAAIRPEGIVIPDGMCLDVPVKLVEDDDGLALAVIFRRAKLRNATEEAEQEATAATKE